MLAISSHLEELDCTPVPSGEVFTLIWPQSYSSTWQVLTAADASIRQNAMQVSAFFNNWLQVKLRFGVKLSLLTAAAPMATPRSSRATGIAGFICNISPHSSCCSHQVSVRSRPAMLLPSRVRGAGCSWVRNGCESMLRGFARSCVEASASMRFGLNMSLPCTGSTEGCWKVERNPKPQRWSGGMRRRGNQQDVWCNRERTTHTHRHSPVRTVRS